MGPVAVHVTSSVIGKVKSLEKPLQLAVVSVMVVCRDVV